jgi:hypothetical protein
MLANYILYMHMSADLGLLFSLRVRNTLQRRLGKLGIMVITVKSIKKSTVADGRKSSKLIVCKSPGTNIETPGDPFMTLFDSLT